MLSIPLPPFNPVELGGQLARYNGRSVSVELETKYFSTVIGVDEDWPGFVKSAHLDLSC
jgi:hypothetical protein